MALFVMTVVNPNGLEVASSLATTACALRIARSPAQLPPWLWVAVAVSGIVAVLSWQLGPMFVLIGGVIGVIALGRGGLRTLWLRNRRALLVVGCLLAVAAGLWLGYGLAAGTLHSTFSASPLIGSLRDGAHQFRSVLHQAVGDFGLLNIPVGAAVYVAWWAVVLALIGTAAIRGNHRERVVLAAGVVIAVAFPILFDAWVYRHTGFELQARYVLPVLMIPCLVAGEIVRGRGQDRLRWPATVALLVVAVLQLDSWDTAARAASGHSGRVWFMPSAAWSPPLGWWPWAAVATAGALCLVLAAVQTARSSPMSPSLRE